MTLTASVLKSTDFWTGAFYIREVVIVLQSTEEWRWHKGKQTSYKRRKQNNTMKERTTGHRKNYVRQQLHFYYVQAY